MTVYLAKKLLIINSEDFWRLIQRLFKRLLPRGDHYAGSSKVFIATSRQEAFLNCMDIKHLCSSQEETDTRLILHSLDAVQKGPTELYIQSYKIIPSQV